MTLKAYIWLLRLLSLVALAAWILVVDKLSPDTSGTPGRLLFYSTLGIFLSGLFGLFLLFIRRKTLGEETVGENVGLSLRQGILLSILVVSLLILQSFRMLVWWDGLLVVAGIFLVELYFLSRN